MLTMRRLSRVVGAIVLLALSLAAAVASDKYPEKTASRPTC
jgi:hypothetical protein